MSQSTEVLCCPSCGCQLKLEVVERFDLLEWAKSAQPGDRMLCEGKPMVFDSQMAYYLYFKDADGITRSYDRDMASKFNLIRPLPPELPSKSVDVTEVTETPPV